jgi:hypothetical protein
MRLCSLAQANQAGYCLCVVSKQVAIVLFGSGKNKKIAEIFLPCFVHANVCVKN